MGSINVGFIDHRNSSRVLKPPGGHSSDIFGVNELKKTQLPIINIADSNQLAAKESCKKTEAIITTTTVQETISVVSKDEQIKTEEESSAEPEVKILEENIKTNLNITQEENGIEEPVVEKVLEQPIKIENVEEKQKRPKARVPPGGYSSGLW